jgi:antagonist of KipI
MLEIIRAGMWTTIQDRGRFQHRRDGVVTAGAMDGWAWQIANLLVGNLDAKQGNLAALEFYLVGPTIHFQQDATIAIYGGSWNIELDQQPIRCGRPYQVRCGQRLEIRDSIEGCWGYLAIAGGIDVPKTLGSRSTHVRSLLGGFKGRILIQGDRLPIGREDPIAAPCSSYAHRFVPWKDSNYGGSRRGSISSAIRFIQGAEWKMLRKESQLSFSSNQWRISKNSDRMGYRLQRLPIHASDSEQSLRLSQPFEMLSEPTTIGTIQFPPSGEPIVLMADSATTGGYPKIGHIVEVDLPRLAQQKPGSPIQLEPISLGESYRLLVDRQRTWRRLVFSIQTRPKTS